MRSFTFAVLASLVFDCTNAQKELDLSGDGWTLTNPNGSISVPAKVPSQNYLDLFAAGIIGDPLYGLNNVNEEWVRLSNWTYTSPSIRGLQTERGIFGLRGGVDTFLVFEGLDTYTTIEMCGTIVGTTDNQFRQYVFDVSNALKSCRGDPKLSINFGSANTITAAIVNSSSADGNVNFANSCYPENNAACKPYVRKEQNDFGWDWSPSLSPAGPWRSISLVQLKSRREELYVNNTAIDIYRKGQMPNIVPDQSQPWVFNASLDFIGNLPRGASLELELWNSDGQRILSKGLQGVYSNGMTITGSTIIDPSLVEMWWPNGLGQQALYQAKVKIVSKGILFGIFRRTLGSTQKRVGFRTIVLDLSPVTADQEALGIAPGANWHFEVNGKEFYAKGSNLVPPDTFWPRVNETKIRQLFQLAVDGNQNMLRVWSSGAYLDDYIYDMADEMGLLLWSEFQFTDAIYPNSTHFLESYEAEAYYNVRRVNHHPSLALWAGGNELEAVILAFWFDPSSTSAPGPQYEYYRQIQEELLIKCVYANTRSISYIPSSTYHGYINLDFDSVRPQTPRYENSSGPGYYYSDTDLYSYGANQIFDESTYPVGRFANEFGLISMPSIEAWQSVADNPTSFNNEVVVNHNKHLPGFTSGSPEELSMAGIADMTNAVKAWYPQPNIPNPVANFSAWIWSTQVIHAQGTAMQIAFYRRGSGRPERQLGSLYWMLDDLWVAPTWASVEPSGKQKVMYYSSKDVYQPLIVQPYYNASSYDTQVWITSDRMSAVSGTFEYQWLDWSGKQLSVGSDMTDTGFSVGALNSTQVLHYNDVLSTLKSESVNTTNAVLRLAATGSDGSNTYSHSSYFVPVALKDAELEDPGLKLTMGSSSRSRRAASQGSSASGTMTFEVTATKAVAAWVWLDYSANQVQGYWSDNAFWLNKGESRMVTFTVWNDWTGNGGWVDSVTVRSMWDNIGASSVEEVYNTFM